MKPRQRLRRAAAGACTSFLVLLGGGAVHADQGTASSNGNNQIAATASLDFEITVNKFVMLRLGAPDATLSDVTFTVGVTPAVAGAPGNSRPYSAATPPAFATTVATTNPGSGAGALQVAAFTNVTGTTITCSLATLPGATAFAAGATSAAGVPGTGTIQVGASAGGVPHPGGDLSACNGVTSAAVPLVSNLTGTYAYSASFVPANLAAGTYGNQVTYTITAP